jgi:hypothetical protein
MSGFLDLLVGRTLGTVPSLQPRRRALFEPPPGERPADTLSFVEVAVAETPRQPDQARIPPTRGGVHHLPVSASGETSNSDEPSMVRPGAGGPRVEGTPAAQPVSEESRAHPPDPVVSSPVVSSPVPAVVDSSLRPRDERRTEPSADPLPAVGASAREPDESSGGGKGGRAEATLEERMGRWLDTTVTDGADRRDVSPGPESSADSSLTSDPEVPAGSERPRQRRDATFGTPAGTSLEAPTMVTGVAVTPKAAAVAPARRPPAEGEPPSAEPTHEKPPGGPSAPAVRRSSPRRGRVPPVMAIPAERAADVGLALPAGVAAMTQELAVQQRRPPESESERRSGAPPSQSPLRGTVPSKDVVVGPPRVTVAPPRVSVQIGRVVVTSPAPTAAPPPVPAPPPPPPARTARDTGPLSLEDYLRHRDGGSS